MENQNKALEDLSRMFVHNPGDPTPGNELIDTEAFDFSVDSLAVLDDHIDALRTHELPDDEWNVFILRSGAYVGEVIRRAGGGDKRWNWLSHAQAVDVSDFVASREMTIETAAVLWDGDDGVIFPLGKVAKFLANGREDSVHFYAQVIIAGPPPVG